MVMANDSKELGRRRLLALITATPAALAAAHVLNGCGGAQQNGNDSGVVPDGDVVPDGMLPDGMLPDGTVPDGMVVTPDADVSCSPTTPDALGPFFSSGAPVREQIASAMEAGSPLRIEGRLLDVSDCRTPLAGWGLDLWQADDGGNYHDGPATGYRLRCARQSLRL